MRCIRYHADLYNKLDSDIIKHLINRWNTCQIQWRDISKRVPSMKIRLDLITNEEKRNLMSKVLNHITTTSNQQVTKCIHRMENYSDLGFIEGKEYISIVRSIDIIEDMIDLFNEFEKLIENPTN